MNEYITVAGDTLPPRVVVYGKAGVGKTTFACNFPKPLVIDFEGGIPAGIPVSVVSYVGGQMDRPVLDVITDITTEDHDYRTLVVDSIDALDSWLSASLCTRMGWQTIADGPHGQGYVLKSQMWQKILARMDGVRRERDMGIVLVGHSAILIMSDPRYPDYNYLDLSIRQADAAQIMKWSDIMGLATFNDPSIKVESSKQGSRKRVLSGTKDRLFLTELSDAYVTKSRYPELPGEIALEYTEFSKYIPSYQPKK
jgi:hypothetical protein